MKVRGPKGAFQVEMQRENAQDRTIACRYNPTEPGIYHIAIRWNGEHVHGSPFQVHIFESEKELELFRHRMEASRSVDQKHIDKF